MKRYPRVLDVARMGHPILHQKAALVDAVDDPEIREIVADMIATAEFLHATGLGAPQARIPLQILVYRIRPKGISEETPMASIPWTVMINPNLEPVSEKMTGKWESCLSLPELTGFVHRYDHVKCSYTTLDGESEVIEAKGYLARVLQHEYDHVQGVLYPQRLKDFGQFGFRAEVTEHHL